VDNAAESPQRTRPTGGLSYSCAVELYLPHCWAPYPSRFPALFNAHARSPTAVCSANRSRGNLNECNVLKRVSAGTNRHIVAVKRHRRPTDRCPGGHRQVRSRNSLVYFGRGITSFVLSWECADVAPTPVGDHDSAVSAMMATCAPANGCCCEAQVLRRAEAAVLCAGHSTAAARGRGVQRQRCKGSRVPRPLVVLATACFAALDMISLQPEGPVVIRGADNGKHTRTLAALRHACVVLCSSERFAVEPSCRLSPRICMPSFQRGLGSP